MCTENEKIYPNCQMVIKTVEIGGLTKSQLIQKLQQCSVLVNESGKRLLTDNQFTTTEIKYSLNTVELTVGNLGLPDGANTDILFKRAKELGLDLCPLELGPFLRLQYLDQPEGYSGKPLTRNQAPFGSITIASKILNNDYDFPKGFYLRRINGVLWLRGYRADHLHVWNPDDHFIFCQGTKM